MHVIDGNKLGAGSKHKVTKELKTLRKTLESLLDDRFALIHTLSTSGRREVVDALVVGPHGALILKVDGSSGRHRCLGDNWYTWDKKLKNFVDAENNPILELKQGLNFIESYLVGQGMGSTVPIQGAVVFVDPKLQLEHMEPSVPLVESKLIKDLAAELMDSPAYLEPGDSEKVLALFGARARLSATPFTASPSDQLAQKSAGGMQSRSLFGFKRWQLIALAAMIVVYLLVLAALLYVLFVVLG